MREEIQWGTWYKRVQHTNTKISHIRVYVQMRYKVFSAFLSVILVFSAMCIQPSKGAVSVLDASHIASNDALSYLYTQT